jgi:DNA-binding transcriptional ArsR family regulator
MKRPDIFELHAGVCSTLSSPTRLKILALLGKKERSVGEMAEIISVSPSNLSQHLAVLSAHQLVTARKQVRTVFYSLTDRRIIQACSLTRSVLLDQMRMRGEVAQDADEQYALSADS